MPPPAPRRPSGVRSAGRATAQWRAVGGGDHAPGRRAARVDSDHQFVRHGPDHSGPGGRPLNRLTQPSDRRKLSYMSATQGGDDITPTESAGRAAGAGLPTTVKARGLLPSLSPAEQRVARVVIDEAGDRRAAHHHRAGRPGPDLGDHGDPVLPGDGLRRLPAAAAHARRRGRAGRRGRLPGPRAGGQRHQRDRRRWPTWSRRSPSPTPGRSRTPPSSSTSRCWSRWSTGGGRPAGGHLRRRRERVRGPGLPAEAAPDRPRSRSPGATCTSR